MWDLLPLPIGKNTIGHSWVFATKFNLELCQIKVDGFVFRLKACVVAKAMPRVME